MARPSKVYEALLAMPEGWHRAKDISERSGTKLTSTSHILTRMAEQGLVLRDKRGDYHYAPVYWRLSKPKEEARASYNQYLDSEGK